MQNLYIVLYTNMAVSSHGLKPRITYDEEIPKGRGAGAALPPSPRDDLRLSKISSILQKRKTNKHVRQSRGKKGNPLLFISLENY